ncbi:hypothetical protein JAAARDRAFT_136652 [Jaapia argillacea MUCL 33604]|uniref:F-box domain-containing protein n=1 Tax=Jaapia argillacea MUCL 33604 TaxID=933084 RepID=A0A067PQY9_9AGAM|nr:hypothetical protein JAAARDRAFT_136652 [Jaapia argillacea MUCL 33604]
MSVRVKSSCNSLAKGRPRRPIQPVDTNLQSYDRTDPFTAFNVLRKLLAGLVSRIGGCQYKLTPQEHKLSIHLLSIVEPFVGLSPSQRTITQQPTEILDAIVYHLDSKRDLLALGLTCRRLHGIVFPRHYDYRIIRCKVSSIRVWNHLVVHKSLARNVRRLEILDERSSGHEFIPRGILTSDTDLESTDDELGMHVKQERYLVAALLKMTALQSFIWSCNHSPMCIDDVWPTLMKFQSLREVEINDNLVFSGSRREEGASEPTTKARMLDLKNVSLRATKHSYGSTKNPDLIRIFNLLNQCPILESLSVGYDRPNGIGYSNPLADNFFLCGRWPLLRTLVLTNLNCTYNQGREVASTFFLAHPNLEVLHIDIGFHVPNPGGGIGKGLIEFAPNSLPRLRELKSNMEVINAILQCPCDQPRPLETLKGVKFSSLPVTHGTLLANLAKHGGELRRVELAGWNEMDDLKRMFECWPKLTWLDLGRRANVFGMSNVNKPNPNVANVVSYSIALPFPLLIIVESCHQRSNGPHSSRVSQN